MTSRDNRGQQRLDAVALQRRVQTIEDDEGQRWWAAYLLGAYIQPNGERVQGREQCVMSSRHRKQLVGCINGHGKGAVPQQLFGSKGKQQIRRNNTPTMRGVPIQKTWRRKRTMKTYNICDAWVIRCNVGGVPDVNGSSRGMTVLQDTQVELREVEQEFVRNNEERGANDIMFASDWR